MPRQMYRLGHRTADVLDSLTDEAEMSVADVQAQVGCSYTTAYKILVRLERAGCAKRHRLPQAGCLGRRPDLWARTPAGAAELAARPYATPGAPGATVGYGAARRPSTPWRTRGPDRS